MNCKTNCKSMKMNSNCLIKTTLLLLAALFLGVFNSACVKEEKEINPEVLPYNTGVKLSYTTQETTMSTGLSKGNEITLGGLGLNVSKKRVEIFFDETRENYQIKTRLLETNKKTLENFSNSEISEIVETKNFSSFHDMHGRVISTISNNSKQSYDLSFMLASFPERAKEMRKLLRESRSSKSGGLNVEVQNDTSVVKISKVLVSDENFDEVVEGYTSVSYVNTFYGVPVVSELYDRNMQLVSKTTHLYRLIDNIPIVAYEEVVSFTKNQDDEWVEHRTITNYENIKISNF